MKFGIFGGTFNPIHQGHLIHAENIRSRKRLDKIIFIPSKNPPHKMNLKILDFDIRKTMVEIAIQSNPYFFISEIEAERLGPSYTAETLVEFKNLYPRDEIFLILGSDSILSIESWKDYKNILENTKIIIIDRDKKSIEDTDKAIERYKINYGGNIEKVEGPLIEISSTDIRERIKEGLSIKYYLPEPLEEYIKDNLFYFNE